MREMGKGKEVFHNRKKKNEGAACLVEKAFHKRGKKGESNSKTKKTRPPDKP